MTPKRSAIALRLPSEAGPRSRFRRESHDVFNFSHGKIPNLMVFSEISFWNEMFLSSIKAEMFAVEEL